MIGIGQFHDLEILRLTSVGLFLGDDTGEEVLLPNKYCPAEFEFGGTLRVFVYRDHEERKVATNIIPKIQLNGYALLRVTAVSDVGAFLDWGMEKELLVPFKEQNRKLEEGRSYVVRMLHDPQTDRLYASNRIEKQLSNDPLTVEVGDEVDLLVYRQTELGHPVIVNGLHQGLIYANEVFSPIKVGDRPKGFIKQIREDNKLDISLQPIGYANYNDANMDLIHRKLVDNQGFLAVSDKSLPERIQSQFGMSKKAFKKAIGALYKLRAITISDEGIKLVQGASK